MSIELYSKAFIDSFEVTIDELGSLKYQSIPTWDSIGHMSLIATLEESFQIELDIDDIIEFSSYERGKLILKKYAVDL